MTNGPVGDHVGRVYPLTLVGPLWVCGFLNYADRQAVRAKWSSRCWRRSLR